MKKHNQEELNKIYTLIDELNKKQNKYYKNKSRWDEVYEEVVIEVGDGDSFIAGMVTDNKLDLTNLFGEIDKLKEKIINNGMYYIRDHYYDSGNFDRLENFTKEMLRLAQMVIAPHRIEWHNDDSRYNSARNLVVREVVRMFEKIKDEEMG